MTDSNSNSSPSTTTKTETTTNSYNKTYSVDNVGNIAFGTDAINAMQSGADSDSLTKYLPYAFGLVGVIVLLSFFKGGK